MAKPFFIVGGYVRDQILGVKSKDVDYTVPVADFDELRAEVNAKGWEIKKEEPAFLRIRALHPTLGGVDVVACRKDGYYADGRRPDEVFVGTFEEDMARRDFTCGAMALDESGKLIDLFGGEADTRAKVLRCVGDTRERMSEDSLRILRAIRFSITKGFRFSDELYVFLRDYNTARMLRNLSANRVRDELERCFEFDTPATIEAIFRTFPFIGDEIYSSKLRLQSKVLPV